MIETIAEIGWNHLGNMDLAEEMIGSAAKAGATYAKFQTWKTTNLIPGPWDNDGRRELYKKAELTSENHVRLKAFCDSCQIKFLTSVFSEDCVDLVRSLTDVVKIPSPEIANKQLLHCVVEANFAKIFLSTGASRSWEIDEALNILSGQNLVLMHCVSCYPCPSDLANLEKIDWLKKKHTNVGYSGHVEGIMDALASIQYGIVAIEKHFTIDKTLSGRDNQFAIVPDQLTFLVEYIKKHEEMCKLKSIESFQEEDVVRTVYRGRWGANDYKGLLKK